MKALVLERPGSLANLSIADIALPQPRPGELRVRVHAVGLNPIDYKLAQGNGHPAWRFPFVLGLDVAGVVDAVGEEVQGWEIGDRVVYHGDLSRPGGYAEYAVTAAHVAARIPKDVSFVEAAALPCAGYTAYQAVVRKLHLEAGQTILVQGGAGGVGGFAIQLAAGIGAIVYTTASPQNFDYVQKLGAQHAIDYHSEDIAGHLHGLTKGRGVDAIVDTVGRATATAGLDMLAFSGGIACVESLPDFSHFRSFDRALSVHDIALGSVYRVGDRKAQEDLARMGAEMLALLQAGKLNPLVSEICALDAVPDGLHRLAQRHVRGKIVAQLIA